ncbi:MAG: DUF3987 domain-containing protein [Solirubrobacteraceae bacterium]
MTALSLLDQPPHDDQGAGGGSELLPAPAGWPAPPEEAVYHELLGEIITRIAPETEADPVAILTQLLVAFGAAVGRGAWFSVEATRHHPNEYMCLVGDSSRSRKGSSWDHVRRLILAADPSLEPRILTGLSSGEGVIWAVRDPSGQDPGVSDQRLLVIEPEFASALKAAGREISTLSPTLRSAWDGRPLAILTRTSPARASAAHIALIGHITQHELRRYTSSIELANGYINRLLLIACRRQRLLPDGGDPDPLHATGLSRLLTAAVRQARTAGEIRLDPDARELWHHAYRQLATEPSETTVGQITARAEAHVIRLALLYTLADGKHQIGTPQLHAALAMQNYAARSAAWALTGATGDPLAEQIHATLRQSNGLTRSQINQALNHNQPAGQIDTALQALHTAGRVTSTQIATGGRPARLWTATTSGS